MGGVAEAGDAFHPATVALAVAGHRQFWSTRRQQSFSRRAAVAGPVGPVVCPTTSRPGQVQQVVPVEAPAVAVAEPRSSLRRCRGHQATVVEVAMVPAAAEI